ncbi:hypothetical protein FRX31_006803 [Thalictrum thalictroides]|uniref:Uncharacterized protein n=1 Tax=Thalictrum thalictroides TaxID=46969 RepID=A0A7J6X1K0_THATH|nr:hypothetical protein FRX31_006803 [Thalictrum thalictroides]
MSWEKKKLLNNNIQEPQIKNPILPLSPPHHNLSQLLMDTPNDQQLKTLTPIHTIDISTPSPILTQKDINSSNPLQHPQLTTTSAAKGSSSIPASQLLHHIKNPYHLLLSPLALLTSTLNPHPLP